MPAMFQALCLALGYRDKQARLQQEWNHISSTCWKFQNDKHNSSKYFVWGPTIVIFSQIVPLLKQRIQWKNQYTNKQHLEHLFYVSPQVVALMLLYHVRCAVNPCGWVCLDLLCFQGLCWVRADSQLRGGNFWLICPCLDRSFLQGKIFIALLILTRMVVFLGIY